MVNIYGLANWICSAKINEENWLENGQWSTAISSSLVLINNYYVTVASVCFKRSNKELPYFSEMVSVLSRAYT